LRLPLPRLSWFGLLGTIPVVLLFGFGIWLRITSLEAMPDHSGDESVFGLQAERLLSGRHVSMRAPTGHLLDPFTIAMHLPTHLLAEPSLTLLRLPAVGSNLLLLVLLYIFLSRIYDRTTALMASALMASLPTAIVISRLGMDFSLSPLFGFFALAAALRARGRSLVLAVVASLLVHPTNLFLIPIALPVYLAAVYQHPLKNALKIRRAILGTTIALTVIGVVFGLICLMGPVAGREIAHGHKSPHWAMLPQAVARFFTGISVSDNRYVHYAAPSVSKAVVSRAVGGFWLVILPIFAFGMLSLIRKREWDRVVLVASIFVTTLIFHQLAGPEVLAGDHWRYGVFLIVPAVIAVASLARATLVAPTTSVRCLARALQVVGFYSVCGILLYSSKTYYFDYYTATGEESVWTLRSESVDAQRRALDVIAKDHRQRRSDGIPGLIVAENWWTLEPIRYLAQSRHDFRVADLNGLGPNTEEIAKRLQVLLSKGAYVVCLSGEPLDRALGTMHPGVSIREWQIPNCRGERYLVIYTLGDEGETRSNRTDVAGGRTAKPI
jgi:hypothetical protein